MSGTGTNLLTEENKGREDLVNKEAMTNKFVTLIDNLNQLNKTLNRLIKSGYPFISHFSLKIENSETFDEKDKSKNLQKIIEEYKSESKKFKKIIKRGYQTKPLLRLFYAYQFIQIHEQILLPVLLVFLNVGSVAKLFAHFLDVSEPGFLISCCVVFFNIKIENFLSHISCDVFGKLV